jgi:MoxR-like ATPase
MNKQSDTKSLTLKKRIAQLLGVLQQGFIERNTATRLALLSLLSGEHLLLFGAPGTAKSELARRLHLALQGGDYFERLLTKFSVPEELFGPLSIKSLEQDRYHRLTKNYLPSATIAFIDEIFKANSAILNSLLTLLNEREFDNGDQRVKVPLLCVIGASNELPEENELAALYDRFLCRYEVKPVSEEQFLSLLLLSESAKEYLHESSNDRHSTLSLDELSEITRLSMTISIPEDVLNLLQSLRLYLFEQNIHVSDRRWRKVVKLLQVSAFTNGQKSVSVWDCFLLQHCLWTVPKQRNIINNWYLSHLGIGSGFNQERIEKLVRTWETTQAEEQSRKVHLKNPQGELLYTNQQGKQTNLKEEMTLVEKNSQIVYLAPPDNEDRTNNDCGYSLQDLKEQFFDDYYQQCHIEGHWIHIDKYIKKSENQFNKLVANKALYEPEKYLHNFIEKRINETQSLSQDLSQFSQSLKEQASSLSEELAEHLWITDSFSQQAELSLIKAKAAVESLQKRVEKVVRVYQQFLSDRVLPCSSSDKL